MIKRVACSGVVLTLLFSTSILKAEPQILALSEIKEGMHGYAKTVFQGDKIEEFPVEVVGVLKNFFSKRSVILIRLLGEKAQFTGVVAGMSGSPVYIQDKLVGALAYRFGSFQKEPIAGVTPIEEMLEIPGKESIRDEEEPVPQFSATAFWSALGIPGQRQAFWKEITLRWSKLSARYPEGMENIPLLLSVSGISPAVFNRIQPVFEEAGLVVTPGGGRAEDTGAPLEPGASISAVLVDGDLNFDATGTVTYRKDNSVLAFGHPFFDQGPINLPMAQASIVHTLSLLSASTKMANTGKIVGNLRQDRTTGIFGVLGAPVNMYPLQIDIQFPGGEKTSFSYRIAQDKSINSLMSFLTFSVIADAMESARLSGSGTSLQVSARIYIQNYGILPFENFYGGMPGFFEFLLGGDSALANAAFDLTSILASIFDNGFVFPNLEKVEIQLEVVRGRNSAVLKRAWTDKTTVAPGESLQIFYILKPWMKDEEQHTLTVKVPESIREGTMQIFIGGGQEATLEDVSLFPITPYSFEDVLRLLKEKRISNRLYVFLEQPEGGLYIHGKDFPSLPPSISSVLESPRVPKDSFRYQRKIISENSEKLRYEITGKEMLSVQIEKEEMK